MIVIVPRKLGLNSKGLGKQKERPHRVALFVSVLLGLYFHDFRFLRFKEGIDLFYVLIGECLYIGFCVLL
mgnify:FL=1